MVLLIYRIIIIQFKCKVLTIFIIQYLGVGIPDSYFYVHLFITVKSKIYPLGPC